MLSGSIHSFTHYIEILISYLCQTCVGGTEFEIIKLVSNLDGLWWSSPGFMIMKPGEKKIGLFGQREETLLKIRTKNKTGS